MLQVVKFNEVIDNVYKETAPHKLCAYIYDLANDFNKFYHETKILAEEDEEKKKGYLALLTLAKKYLRLVLIFLDLQLRKGCNTNYDRKWIDGWYKNRKTVLQ